MVLGLRKPKFQIKCKSYIKPIKTRLDTILKKKKAVLKYLKNDIAELLQNNFDINAYGRVEGLIVEQNVTSCYEQIGTFCTCILEHLQALQMQKECPGECKEAVHSLIYAAARFADLPELRSLRTLFAKKFGDSDDTCVNKEFVQKLNTRAFTNEMKLQLLRDVAQEHSLKWDSKPLEKKLCTPPSLEQEKHKFDEELEKRSEDSTPKREDLDDRNRQGKWGKSFASDEEHIAETGFAVQGSSEYESSTDISSQDGGKTGSSSIASVSEEEVEDKRPFYYRFIPPPYLKPKTAVEETNSAKPSASSPRIVKDKGLKHSYGSPAAQEKKVKPVSVRSRRLKSPPAGHEDKTKSPKVENVKGKKTHTPRKEERQSLNSPRVPGKSKSYANAHQQQDAYDHGHEHSRRGRPSLNVHMPGAEKKSNEDMPIAASPKHPKLPEYDEFTARLAALRRNENKLYTAIA